MEGQKGSVGASAGKRPGACISIPAKLRKWRVGINDHDSLFGLRRSPSSCLAGFVVRDELVERPIGDVIDPITGFGVAVALPVTLRPIVRNTQHLAVLDRGIAALAPGRHMVRFHFAEHPDFALVGGVTGSA